MQKTHTNFKSYEHFQGSTALLHLFNHLRNDMMAISEFVFLYFVMYHV